MVKVKICGITNLEDALNAADAGCDALGFIFYKPSPRYITPEKASKIIRHLPPQVLKVGVFVDAQEKAIRRIAKLCRLDMLQFHGKESPAFCARFSGCKVIKAFRVKKSIDCELIRKYNTFACLFDTFVKSKRGGTGRKFDWSLLADMDAGCEVFLSGGLTARNVQEALKIVRPDWVDATSSLETKPGRKDAKRIKEFIDAVRKSTF